MAFVNEQLGDILRHNSFVEYSIFLLIAFDEESSRLPEQHMDDCHVEEALSSSNVRTLDPIPKKDVGEDDEVDVAAMRRHQHNRPIITIFIALQLKDGLLVDDHLLVDLFEHLMHEPGE